MRLKKHTLSFIVAFAVTFMAIESAMAIGRPANLAATVNGNKVTLTWDAVSGATGYKLHYSFGKFTDDYDSSVDVGNVTSIEYEGLPDGAYFVAITAYDGLSEGFYSYSEVFVKIGTPGKFYQFERLWPTLPQPWYFQEPQRVAVDNKKGYVYVTLYDFHMVMKFDTDGNFITKWGSKGSGDGQFLGMAA